MTVISRRRFLERGTASLVAASGLAAPAIAQVAYPNRPIKFVVPALPGSRTDIAARIFAGSLQRDLGQPFEIVNPDLPPAMAYATLASAPADGYTIGVMSSDIAIMHWRGVTALTPKDFTSVALFGEDPAGIHVRADAPWQNAKQFIDDLRGGKKLTASSTPKGGIWHLSTVGLLAALGLTADKMPWTPSPNPAAALEDLSLGAFDAIVCSVPEVRATPSARQIKTLAVMADKRSPRFGDVPTLREAAGIAYTSGNWRGLAGPNGLPADVALVLATAAKKTWGNPDYQGLMRRRGFGAVWAQGPEFGKYADAHDKRMGDALKAAGMLTS